MNDQSVHNLMQSEYLFSHLSSLGDFYPLTTEFDSFKFQDELSSNSFDWVRYNKSKSWSFRYGLSLFSLDGSIDGAIDLNSVREWNKKHDMKLTEMSFRAPTPIWSHFQSISDKFNEIESHLGRSHLLRLDEGGIFPPHRDSYKGIDPCFRLIAFFNTSPEILHLVVDSKICHFSTNRVYFLNTRKIHSVVSFAPGGILLVLNVDLNPTTTEYVVDRVLQR